MRLDRHFRNMSVAVYMFSEAVSASKLAANTVALGWCKQSHAVASQEREGKGSEVRTT
jgi:hypothetical protein